MKTIEDAIVNQYQNPFDLNTVPCEMINIITGQVAMKEIEKSLTSLQDTGLSKLQAFIEARLVESTKSISFWDPESRLKTPNFTDMKISLPGDKQC